MPAYYRASLEREFPDRDVIFRQIGDADPTNPARASELLRDFARQAAALGCTVSAEHDRSKRKRHLLELQYSAADIEMVRAVKRRLDPANTLGRGTRLD
jgi:FAD/FMN-containing dehydrogenase